MNKNVCGIRESVMRREVDVLARRAVEAKRKERKGEEGGARTARSEKQGSKDVTYLIKRENELKGILDDVSLFDGVAVFGNLHL